MWVGFLYTSTWSCLSSPMITAKSRKARMFFFASSRVNLMLFSTALIQSVKASISWHLILTQVSSSFLNQWLGVVPGNESRALLSSSSMYKLATVSPQHSRASACRSFHWTGNMWSWSTLLAIRSCGLVSVLSCSLESTAVISSSLHYDVFVISVEVKVLKSILRGTV